MAVRAETMDKTAVAPPAIESRKRSVVKAATYRIVIIVLDFAVVYLLTGRTSIALGFMLLSNVYTTVAYFLHERLWTRIHWGMGDASPGEAPAAEAVDEATSGPSLGIGRQ
jgi:uncharacterized membrane protein